MNVYNVNQYVKCHVNEFSLMFVIIIVLLRIVTFVCQGLQRRVGFFLHKRKKSLLTMKVDMHWLDGYSSIQIL